MSPFVSSSAAYDPQTTFTGTLGYNCAANGGFLGQANPSWCPDGNTNTSPLTVSGANAIAFAQPSSFTTPVPSFVLPTSSLVTTSGRSANAYCQSQNLFSSCGYAQATLGNGFLIYNSVSSALTNPYGISGTITYPWTLLGNDQNFLNQWPEPVPPTNPFKQTATVLGTTQIWNIYRFEFVLQLKVIGDNIQASTSCVQSYGFNTANLCLPAELNALQSIIPWIDANDKISGKVLLDLSIPDPFYVTTNQDKFGIIGGWIASGGCSISPAALPYKGVAQAVPCAPHVVVNNNLQGFTPASNEPTLSNEAIQSGTNLNPNAQFSIQLTSIGPTYTAVCSGSSCTPNGGGDCLSNGSCSIQYDSGITIQIPIIVDVQGSSPTLYPYTSPSGNCIYGSTGAIGQNPNCNPPPSNCAQYGNCSGTVNTCLYGGQYPSCSPPNQCQTNPQACNVTNSTSGGCGTATPGTCYNSPNGSIKIHVQDAQTNFPLSGVQIGYSTAGSCSTVNPVNSTDTNGNVILGALPPGGYTVCAVGTGAQIQALLIGLSVTYSQNQVATAVTAGKQSSALLILQTNVSIYFLPLAIGLILVLIAVAALFLAFRPRQAIQLVQAAAPGQPNTRRR